MNRFITVAWLYNHTGGLPITNVSVLYSVNDSSSNVNNLEITLAETDATSVNVSDLKPGFEYVFNITANNNHGYTSILCGPVLYVTGEHTLIIYHNHSSY